MRVEIVNKNFFGGYFLDKDKIKQKLGAIDDIVGLICDDCNGPLGDLEEYTDDILQTVDDIRGELGFKQIGYPKKEK